MKETHSFEARRFQISPWHVIAMLLATFVVYRFGLIAYRLWFHPLRQFPGPRIWAMSDLPFTYMSSISGTGIREISKAHKKYGPLIRIGPNRIAMDGAIGWPDVYARRQPGQPEFEKSPGFFAPGFSHAIIASQRETHRRQRRQLGHAFSEAALREQEAIISQYVDLLVKRVGEHAMTGTVMNVVEWLNFTTFDIIGDLTFGESFGSLQNSDYHPWVLNFFNGFRADAMVRACRYYPLLGTPLVKLFGGKRAKVGEKQRALAQSKSLARMSLGREPKGRRDFMTYMLQPNRDGHPGLSQLEIMSNSPLLVLAGSETTASALSGFFFYMDKNPEATRIVIDEIRNRYQDASDITMLSTTHLEYLHATIEETLRMYPPVGMMPPRRCPGAEIDGIYIPKGVDCYVVAFATFRNPAHWLEPETFYPGRWLKPDHPLYEKRFANDNHSVFKPFSNGPRDCIGKNLAYAEMGLIVAMLLYSFDFEVLPGQDDWHERQIAFGIWHKGPLNVRFTPRKAA